MENYVRAPKEKIAEGSMAENEVRIVASNSLKSYISYALKLFQEKGHSTVVFKAMGRAINKAVAIAEVIKRRVEGLHQVTEIGSQDITDTWEPTLPGLNKLEIVRHVSVLTITLSTAAQNSGSPGYQLPLAKELVQPLVLGEDGDDPLALELEARGERSGGENRRGGGRPPRGPRGPPREPRTEGAAEGAEPGGGGGGTSRGRRRGGRGRGRGGRGRDRAGAAEGGISEVTAATAGLGI